MLDLDEFKKINDEYGHAVGDNALIEMSQILRKVCKGSNDFIVRMGGDEFLILGERPTADEVIKLMNDISSAAKEINACKTHEYLLQPSMGYSIYSNSDTKDTFFAAADKAMYKDKQEHKLVRSKYY